MQTPIDNNSFEKIAPAVAMTKAEYARHKGVTRGRVTQWQTEGLLVVDDLGRVDVAATDARLAETIDRTNGRPRIGGALVGSLEEARKRELNARADKQHLEAARLAESLLDRSEALRAIDDVIVYLRERLLAMPDRLAVPAAAAPDAEAVRALIDVEVLAAIDDSRARILKAFGVEDPTA